MKYDITIDLLLGTVSAVMSRAMATQTETLLPQIDPVDIVMSIECVEVFLFTKFLFPQEVALHCAYCTVIIIIMHSTRLHVALIRMTPYTHLSGIPKYAYRL